MSSHPTLWDLQHHAVPPAYRQALANRGITKVGGVSVPRWNARKSLSMMNAWNIERAFLSVSCPGVHFGDDAAARDLARVCNDDIMATMARYPTRFGGFASLPLPDVDGAVREYERCVASGPMNGVILMSNVGGRYLGEPSYAPLFDRLGRDGGLVFVHPNTHPAKESAGLLNVFYWWFLDTTRSLLSMLEADVPSRFPHLRTLAAHGGGVLPALVEPLRRLRPDLADRLDAWRGQLYFDTAKFVNPDALEALMAFADPSHVVFASDFVWASRSKMRYWTGNLKRHLPGAVAEGIYRDNASQLVGGEGSMVQPAVGSRTLPPLHMHAVPTTLIDVLETAGVAVAEEQHFDIARIRAWAQEYGRKPLLVLDAPALWQKTSDVVAPILERFNEALAGLAKAHPGEFRATGAIDPRDPDLAVAAIDRCEALGLDGVCIYPDPVGVDTTDGLGAAVAERLGRVSGVVVLHSTDGHGMPVLDPHALDSVLMLGKLMSSGEVDALKNVELLATHTYGVHRLLHDNLGMLHYLRRDKWRMGRFLFDYLRGRQLRGEAFLKGVVAD